MSWETLSKPTGQNKTQRSDVLEIHPLGLAYPNGFSKVISQKNRENKAGFK